MSVIPLPAKRGSPMKLAVRVQHFQSTVILDSEHPLIVNFTQELLAEEPADERSLLQLAHQRLSERITPIYTLKERQKASTTLACGRGSCSQRMAVLEAVARSAGVGTRSRALWIDGQFWFPRFPQFRSFLPERILLAWPEFFLDDCWIDIAELYGSLPELAGRDNRGFSNATSETLFEAVGRTAVDWHGETKWLVGEASGSCDLSRFLLADDGIFPSRDAVFDYYGLLLDRPEGRLFELLFGGRETV